MAGEHANIAEEAGERASQLNLIFIAAKKISSAAEGSGGA